MAVLKELILTVSTLRVSKGVVVLKELTDLTVSTLEGLVVLKGLMVSTLQGGGLERTQFLL